MSNFAIIGVGGYIAPRHLEAIHSLGHNLLAAFDPNDSVGVLDRYFPDCAYFTDFGRFEKYISSKKLDFISICSPNHLHSAHIDFSLRQNCDVICEKPLVLTIDELDKIAKVEAQTGHRVNSILQLRVHESILNLKKEIAANASQRHQVDLTYITSRGPWYFESWKGDVRKSGGLTTNIGVHFFDMLTWIFGNAQEFSVDHRSPMRESGTLKLENADVKWLLSIDRNDLPKEAVVNKKTTYRSIQINKKTFEFSEGFTDLHKLVYQNILADNGHGTEANRAAIGLVERLRNEDHGIF